MGHFSWKYMFRKVTKMFVVLIYAKQNKKGGTPVRSLSRLNCAEISATRQKTEDSVFTGDDLVLDL